MSAKLTKSFLKRSESLSSLSIRSVRFGQQINNEKTSNEDNYYEEWNADIYDNRRDGVFD